LSRRASALWTLLALAPASPLLFGDVLLQHDGGVSDWLHSGLGYRVFLGRELARGHLPMWMPDLLSGVPFLPQIEAGALYFPDWPIWALFDATTATAISIAAAILVSAFGARGLARCYGMAGIGATFAGLVFGMAGFHLAHLKHHHMHAAAAWIPWALWCLESGLKGNVRAWPALSIVISIQAFAGHPQISYYTALILVVRTLVVLVPRWRDASARWQLVAAAASAILGGMLAALVLLPTWQFNATSMRATGMDWKAASDFPFWLGDTVSLLAPRLLGSYYNGTWPAGNRALFWEDWLYLGLLPLLGAILALRGEIPSWAKFWFWTSLSCGLLTAGASLPLYGIAWTLIPGMHLFRFPQRFFVIAALGIALLAGRGLSLLMERRPSLKRWVFLVFIVHAVDVTVASRAVIATGPRAAWDAPRSSLSRGIRAPGRISVIGGAEAWSNRRRQIPPTLPIDMRNMESLGRIPIENGAIAFGWRTPNGYTNMVRNSTGRYWTLLRFMIPNAPHVPVIDRRSHVSEEYTRLLERAGTTHVFVPDDSTVPNADLVASDDGWSVFALRHPRPRAFVAGRWTSPIDEDGALLSDTIPVVPRGSPRSPDVADRPASVVEINTDRLEIAAEGPGLLVVNDSYDPDWRVSVDGVSAPMITVDTWQRGVWLAPGAHVIVMRYWPAGLSAGMILALLGAAGCALWTLATRRKAARP